MTQRGFALAFDRASVRAMDEDGRLHVAITPISKANICPYRGNEIPGWESLGLEPDRIYQLLRDPKELEKAASTFNNLPLLSRHVPVSAQDYQPDLVIGSTGTDAKWEEPYLKNSLVVWAKNAIDGVQDNSQKDISSSYHYEPDMTPGVFDGVHYDGVMRNIRGNHVALVPKGRAGSDVVVGDASLKTLKEKFMPQKHVLSRKATLAKGAIIARLSPVLAQDAKIDIDPALVGVTDANFKEKIPEMSAIIGALAKSKLAADATLPELTNFLEELSEVDAGGKPSEDEFPEKNPEEAAFPVKEKPEEEKNKAIDAEPDKVEEWLKAHGLKDEDIAELKALLTEGPEKPEDGEEAVDAEPELKEDKREDEKEKNLVPKPAMDAAIRAAQTAVIARMNAVREAERDVRPYVGELSLAMDSADAVYSTALKMLGVNVAGVHPSAFPTILKMQPLPGSRKSSPKLAQDAAGVKGFNERYPTAKNIGIAG
jgi:hypothetical protein